MQKNMLKIKETHWKEPLKCMNFFEKVLRLTPCTKHTLCNTQQIMKISNRTEVNRKRNFCNMAKSVRV